MAEWPSSTVELNWEGGFKFTSADAHGHSITVEAPQSEKLRAFNLHWGSGIIAEEAAYDGEHHRPTIQLLEFEDGSISVRFCYYSGNGRFQRSPLIVGESDIDGLRGALENTPRLKELLTRLTG